MPDALTVDSAISLLDAATPEPEEAAPVEAATTEATPTAEPVDTQSEAEPTAEDQAGPDEATSEEDADAEAPASLSASEAPRSWDANEREEFATLPRATQDIILSREAERDARVSRAIQEANETKQAAASETAGIQQLATKLSEFLPQALKTFETRWGPAPDWVAYANQVGTDQATQDRWRYEQEREQLGELARSEAQAKALQHQSFVRSEAEKLATVAPELAGPAADQTRKDVAEWAMQNGAVTADELRWVTAGQLAMAHKAMLWDRAQAALKGPKQPASKTAAAPARPGVRPTAAAPTSSRTRAAQDANQRFTRSRSIEDAVALLEQRNR